MKKKVLLSVLFCALAVVFVVLGVRYYNYAVLVSNGFGGTYTSGSGLSQLIFSVVPSDHMFYYADQENGAYILGHYEECEPDSYSIKCQDPEKADTIPPQVVIYKKGDLSFYMTVNGETVLFQKTDSVPVYVAEKSRYS